MDKDSRKPKLPGTAWLLLCGVVVGGLSLTSGLYSWTQAQVMQEYHEAIQLRIAPQNARIQSYLDARILFLEDLARCMELQEPPSRADFQAFVARERSRVKGIQALEWAPKVLPAQRPGFEVRLRGMAGGPAAITERDGAGHLRQALSRPAHFPVFFLEPLAGNEAAQGYDLGSNAQRLAAIEAARDSGQPRITEPIRLVQDEKERVGFLIFAPVFAKGMPAGSQEERRMVFRGVVLGVFFTDDVLAAALAQGQDPELAVDLSDPAAMASGIHRVTWRWPQPATANGSALSDRAFPGSAGRVDSLLPIAGRTWKVSYMPSAAFRESHLKLLPSYMAPAGIVLTLLLTAYLFQLLTGKRRAEKMVENRSMELRASLTALSEQDDDLRLLLDSTAEAIYGIDLQGRCVFCNASLLRTLGYPGPEAVIGRNMHELIHHSHQDGSAFEGKDCRIFKAFREGCEVHVDDEVLWRSDGSCFPAEYWSFPKRRGGAVVGAVVTFVDISDRHNALRQAREAEALWKVVVDGTGDGVWDWCLDTGNVSYSPRALEMIGHAPEEMTNSLTDWSCRVHPDDFEGVTRAVEECLTGQSPVYAFEHRLRCRDGSWKWVLGRGTVIQRDSAGRPLRMLGTNVDISVRKALQHELARRDEILEALGHSVVALMDGNDLEPFTQYLETLGNGAKASRVCLYQTDPELSTHAFTRMDLVQEWCQAEIVGHLQATGKHHLSLQKMDPGKLLELYSGHALTGRAETASPQEPAFYADKDLRSYLALPVLVRGNLWGMVQFEECTGLRSWTRAEQEILRLSAQALGFVLERLAFNSELLHARINLEERVLQRTEELLQANQNLREEMAGRRELEARLTGMMEGLLKLGPDVRTNLGILVGLLKSLTGAASSCYLEKREAAFLPAHAAPEDAEAYGEALSGLDLEEVPAGMCVSVEFTGQGSGLPVTLIAAPVLVEHEIVGILAAAKPAETPWLPGDRTLLGVLSAAAGIEEKRGRARAEGRLIQIQLLQAQKLESVGRLAAGIAHEINTPIQYLSMNLKFLKKTYDSLFQAVPVAGSAAAPQEQGGGHLNKEWVMKETLKVITESMEGIERVAHIVRAMKEFSHPGNPTPTPLDLNRSLESAATVSRNEWKYVANLVLDLAPNLPMVQGYNAELNQVFLNLIINAAQAIQIKPRADGERGQITLSTSVVPDGVEARVRDTGTGIAPEHQGKVFDPFFTTKDVGVGSGQGLMVSYQTVVNMHGGRITFETKPGEGTTFIVRLPLLAAPTVRPERNAE